MAFSVDFPGFEEPDTLEVDFSFGDGEIKDFLRYISLVVPHYLLFAFFCFTFFISGLLSTFLAHFLLFSREQITIDDENPRRIRVDFYILTINVILTTVLSLLTIYIYIKLYRRFKFLQQSTQLGYSGKRISQLLFSTGRKKKSRYFLSDLWFDIVEYIRNPDDGLHSYLSQNPWLEGFVRPSEKDRASWTFEESFKSARKEFELNPEEFVRHLEQFFEYVWVRDLSESLIAYITRPSDRHRRMEIWISIQNKIDLLSRSADVSDPSAIPLASSTALKRSLSVIEGIKVSEAESLATRDQLKRFIQRSVDDGQSRKDDSELTPILICDIQAVAIAEVGTDLH